MKEIWKDIPGYEGLYQASNLGTIRSLDRYVNGVGGHFKKIKGRIMTGGMYSNGYSLVVLSKNSSTVTTSKHILVAKAFLPNPENKRCVNHKNSIRTDNNVSNLEWVTHKENTQHGISKGRINFRGEKSSIAKLKAAQVLEIREAFNMTKNKPRVIDLARSYNVSPACIILIRNRKNWSHI